VPRPGPGDVHPHALRERLAHGLHVSAGLRAEAPPLAAAALGREGHVRLRPGFFAQALRAKVERDYSRGSSVHDRLCGPERVEL
ncbi:unnamed protein product, partial [Ectocarpus sp. 12 AP-2014]